MQGLIYLVFLCRCFLKKKFIFLLSTSVNNRILFQLFYMSNASSNLLDLFNNNFEEAVDQLFNDYYGDLCRKAFRILNNKVISEDIVQDVFLSYGKIEKKYIFKHP